jgi:uncharacterized membrane protein YccC
MERKPQKETIKTILRGRLTLPEMALVEAYMNTEIDEFNTAARERNTLLAEVQDLGAKLADKERSVENYKAWLKESYVNNNMKRKEFEIAVLEADNQRLNRLLGTRTVRLLAEIQRKEAVIQDIRKKEREFRKAVNETLRSSDVTIHTLKNSVAAARARIMGQQQDISQLSRIVADYDVVDYQVERLKKKREEQEKNHNHQGTRELYLKLSDLYKWVAAEEKK